jgi:hypothetical protein
MIKQHKQAKALRDEVAANVDDLTPEQLKELNDGLDVVDRNHKLTYIMLGALALGLVVLGILSL